MPVLSTDIQFKLSITTATTGNAVGQPDPNASLGKFLSTSIVPTGLHGLFPAVTGPQNAASTTDYRCIFVRNANTSGTMVSGIIFISGETPGGTNVYLGVDPFAATTGTSTIAQAVTVADVNSAPTGVSFYNPQVYSTGVYIGDIPPLYCKGLWIRRNALNTGAVNNDGFTLVIQSDTTA